MRAWRVKTNQEEIAFEDAIQGRQSQILEHDIGDFVLKRADGLYAYQLAVVVDDADQGITHVVRGADLLDSTPRQMHLQRLLSLPEPIYAHVPLVVNTHGEKLSKQTLAAPLQVDQPGLTLWLALDFLRQQPPPELAQAAPRELLTWALNHWNLERIPGVRVLPSPTL
ncbi:glutamyl-tRNA synthetase 1, 2, putative [Ricinus communis]|uniref:Glutamyl-tRNA synthetase 1, 2, putative n=1 Tax=Ricinus communis TaxID=3988 RepID=B9TG47_RICCO|nr:glutamyl-tRNA synthetase 1, 2, putative [Ricinus communis]|eukprot:XP_002537216.1 uncharacterized protein LOC8285206 [Ricinus communis]